MANNTDTHTISLMVANKPGVLVRIALIFSRRGYNIDSLVVSPAYNPKYSRMTITAKGDPETLEQIIKQCNKLIDVIHAEEHSELEAVSKEFALLKVKNSPTNKAIIAKHAKQYNAKVVYSDDEAIIIEQTGSSEELDKFDTLMKKYGVIEMVRTGKLLMMKGKQTT